MELSVFDQTLRLYFEAFSEPDRVRRKQLLSQCLTEDAEIWGPRVLFKGYDSISDKIDGFHSRMPGARLVLASGLYIFRNIARLDIAIVGSDGTLIGSGDSVVELAADGRIFRVLPFWEALPPTPQSWPRHLAR
jgi:hypothetical protein